MEVYEKPAGMSGWFLELFTLRELLPRDANKAAFCELVKSGPPPGLLAFDEDLAVGWCQLTPRHVLP
jgi:hypothetical protein